MPKVTISNKKEIDEIRGKILCSAERTVGEIRRMVDADPTPIEVLRQIKFAPDFGFHPVRDQRLNLIEQVNQTFTCLVSLAAASEIMRRHPDCLPLHLNMGTSAGSDIQSDDKTVAAEVFTAVRRTNNSKLAKDTAKVAGTKAIHKYVFFFCPGEPACSEHFRGVEIVAVTEEQMLGLT